MKQGSEFKLLALDSWLEKIEDIEKRNKLRDMILKLEPVLGRPDHLYDGEYPTATYSAEGFDISVEYLGM